MKPLKKLVCAFMVCLTVLSVLVACVTVSAASANDPAIIRFTTGEHMDSKGTGIKDMPTLSKYTFVTSGDYKYSVKLEHFPSSSLGAYNMMPYFKDKSLITMDHKYLRITYLTSDTASAALTLANNAKGGRVDVVPDTSVSGGKWVTSEAVNIDAEGLLERFADGNHNTLIYKNSSADAAIYIKEMAFFTSKEQADKYTFKDTPESEITAVGTSAPAVPQSSEPAVIKFTNRMIMTGEGTGIKQFTDLSKYKFITSGEYKNSVKLEFFPESTMAAYNIMPYFIDESLISKDHKYVRITYLTTDSVATSISIRANAGGGAVDVVPNTAESRGNWVTSAPVNIDAGAIMDRFDVGNHNTLIYNTDIGGAEIYIKEIAFFTSLKQAYEYYGDEMVETYSSMTYSAGGTGTVLSGADYGNNSFNDADGTLDIVYAERTNMSTHYMAKLKFKEAQYIDRANAYMRVLYSADHPDGVDTATMILRNDKYTNSVTVVADLKKTDGFVLSDTVSVPDNMMERFSGTGEYNVLSHNSLIISTPSAGGTYRIKAVYFFPSKESADAFDPNAEKAAKKVTLGKTPIEKFSIVVADINSDYFTEPAGIINDQIEKLTGITLPVIDDSAAKGEYEILVGTSSRPLSGDMICQNDMSAYYVKTNENTVIINAELLLNLTAAARTFVSTYLYSGLSSVPDEIVIPTDVDIVSVNAVFKKYDSWLPVENVENPEHITDGFEADDGKWTEENNADGWKFANGSYKTDAKGETLSYLHIYEKNVTFDAKLTVDKADRDAEAGLMLRYNSAQAYVKAGYDFNSGAWFIEYREGADFYAFRTEVKAAFEKGKAYSLSFTVDGETAALSVNGKETVKSAVTHTTPGRIAVFARNASAFVDDADIVLLSGQGTLIKNIVHTKLPGDAYMEGGTVYEMNDGSLIYQHHSGTAFKSVDNGKTWVSATAQFPVSGYMNVLRLNNGDFMQIYLKDGNRISRTSSDEGKTWVDGGIICAGKYNGTEASAGNMNDKLMQTASGKIFYSQNYEITSGDVNGRRVFCEFYYSDDNGKSWTKSETDSWEIKGNEDKVYFGECKLLECADGTIRMYNSWNDYYGCIVYSESTDGGKTFGPLQFMSEFRTSRSSMQFVRDRYADNDTTYYMVWVYSDLDEDVIGLRRSRLSLARTTDGKSWEYIGDIWRWESNYRVGQTVNHIVDPFIQVTEDYIICGSGFAEQYKNDHGTVGGIHYAQRQHIYSIEKDTLPEGKTLNKFTDIDTGASYYDAVSFAVENGLFNGVSDTAFAPGTNMTRSMFVTVLGRLDGADVSKYSTPTFSDVKAGQWYTSYVEWAAASGIVNGIGGGVYGINNDVTVEQALTIFYRYNGGKSASEKSGVTVADFADSADISDWAADAVKWAVENGIYSGYMGKLEPRSAASRAEVAVMFSNYVKVFG